VQRLIAVVAVTLAGALAGPVTGAPGAEPRPFGLACAPLDGARFCPGNGTSRSVPSWDGIPLDVDVTLPPTGDGPWPTIVLLQGLGGQKRQLEPAAPQPGPGRGPKILPETLHHNNTYFAREGYAVLAYSSRGFGDSCGGGGIPTAQLQPAPCNRGFVRINDVRYEARDTQHLLGRLVDEGISKPGALGATGFSYGGGMAVTLGYLGDRIRLVDGTYVPWTSPKGVPLSLTAVYGQWLWSDLVSAFLPNGRFLDFDPATNDDSAEPLGVLIQSYLNGLVGLAQLDGYVIAPQPPGSPDAPWDLTTAVMNLSAGEPYGEAVQAIAREFRAFHGGFGLPGKPAAMLLESGWNDDVFPPAESLRVYNDLRSRNPKADVALLLGDYGHARAANKKTVARAFNDAAAAFFAEHLLHRGRGPRPGSVLAYTSTCPTAGSAAPPDGGPFTARSWAALHQEGVVIRGAEARMVSSPGGDPLVGQQFDPIPQANPLGTGDPCKTIAAADAPGTAVYKLQSSGFTMLGLPTIRATVATSGAYGQVAGRLWDVAPDGTQRLVTRGVYRLTPDQTGPIVFQLHGNGYTFAPGHTVKLELAPSDAPQFRASNGTFSVRITDLVANLPVPAPGARRCAVRIRLPRARGARVLRLTVFDDGRRIRTVRGRALRRRSVVVRDLPEGRVRVKLLVRERSRAGRTRVVTRTRVVRVCAA
jgi:dienelactone hydrolase